MELLEQRDPAFWRAIAARPEVLAEMGGFQPDTDELSAHPACLPLAGEHGGFFAVSRDNHQRIFEFHTLVQPEGWGRWASRAAKTAVRMMFDRGALMLFTQELVGCWRSKPPRSFGFEPLGDPFEDAHGFTMRIWILTRERWEASPASKRGA